MAIAEAQLAEPATTWIDQLMRPQLQLYADHRRSEHEKWLSKIREVQERWQRSKPHSILPEVTLPTLEELPAREEAETAEYEDYLAMKKAFNDQLLKMMKAYERGESPLPSRAEVVVEEDGEDATLSGGEDLEPFLEDSSDAEVARSGQALGLGLALGRQDDFFCCFPRECLFSVD